MLKRINNKCILRHKENLNEIGNSSIYELFLLPPGNKKIENNVNNGRRIQIKHFTINVLI